MQTDAHGRHDRHAPRDRAPRRGVALMSTLVLMAVLAIGMAVSSMYMYKSKMLLRQEWAMDQTFYLAESGVEHAIAGLLQGKGAEASQPRTRLGTDRCFYWADVTPEPGRPHTYRVVSGGQVGDEFGPVCKVTALVRIDALFAGASRRARIVSWHEEEIRQEPAQTQPTATQPTR